jgi:uncharacterized OB-fold protein
MSSSAIDPPSASTPVEDYHPIRRLPALTLENEFFWRSGSDRCLRIARCSDCGYFAHPPSPRCPRCLSTEMAPTVVSGRAVVEAFTINYEPWEREDIEPYVVAIVSLVEQPSVRLTTNVVDVRPEAVFIGMAVSVVFEQRGDIFLPLFAPDRPSAIADGVPI